MILEDIVKERKGNFLFFTLYSKGKFGILRSHYFEKGRKAFI